MMIIIYYDLLIQYHVHSSKIWTQRMKAGDILGVSQKLGEKRSSKRILELGTSEDVDFCAKKHGKTMAS